ncbi:hypothetical protein LY78DRAFT_657716 [Colletotrichum sublineola]|nr:hypothetical protein LY78DRAFT_657716 [Colletotrichum sublineola]
MQHNTTPVVQLLLLLLLSCLFACLGPSPRNWGGHPTDTATCIQLGPSVHCLSTDPRSLCCAS